MHLFYIYNVPLLWSVVILGLCQKPISCLPEDKYATKIVYKTNGTGGKGYMLKGSKTFTVFTSF